jgi:hypothetical protein
MGRVNSAMIRQHPRKESVVDATMIALGISEIFFLLTLAIFLRILPIMERHVDITRISADKLVDTERAIDLHSMRLDALEASPKKKR